MADQSEQVTFAELMRRGTLEIGDGYRAKNSELGGNGPIFMRAGRLTQSGWDWDGAERFHAELAMKVKPKMAKPRDTVITTKGNSTGRTGYVPNDAPEFVYSPHLSYWRSKNPDELDARYLRYWALSSEFRSQLKAMAHGTDMAPYLSLSDQKRIEIVLPDVEWQRTISEVLGVLDDKIAVSERIAVTARELGLTFYSQSLRDEDSVEVVVESIATALTRGVTPKYTDSSDELTVLNQKCIRGGRVNLEPSRLTLREKVKDPKLLQPNDVLVNSTGVGTLGRVARWTLDLDATVDSHITIVRFNEDKVDPVCAGFAMLRAQPEIEAMGEGSTGQTELRRSQVGELELTLPSPAGQKELRPKLDALEERADQALRESLALAGLRDTLLPQLMSGSLRVRDAEKIVEGAV
ncbi:restriction endonuclease subunit S [Streptomyces sp. NPDC001668]|uniref:restriction endonuclease subunit S n=1 Tax=unclassified Streptomyces TaxID=2593676 RepID=UPI003687180D